MSIQSEIERISGNVQDTISAIQQTGVSVPSGANSNNLPSLAEALANEKQNKLTGSEGQIVGFNSSGEAVAQNAPSSGITQEQADERYLKLSGGYVSGFLGVGGNAGEPQVILGMHNELGFPIGAVNFLDCAGMSVTPDLDSLYAAGLVDSSGNLQTAVCMIVAGSTYASQLGLPAGITMKGPINFAGNKLSLVGTPSADTDAATKGYVDGLIGNINSVLDTINGEVI